MMRRILDDSKWLDVKKRDYLGQVPRFVAFTTRPRISNDMPIPKPYPRQLPIICHIAIDSAVKASRQDGRAEGVNGIPPTLPLSLRHIEAMPTTLPTDAHAAGVISWAAAAEHH